MKTRAVTWTTWWILGMAVTGCCMAGGRAHAQAGADADASYIEQFHARFKQVDPVPALASYATTARYDADWLGDGLKKALEHVSNDQGGIAWGLAYWMISLNEMYRFTNDPKYLAANLECIRAVMAVRDDKLGIKLWTGAIAPAWSSDKYAKRGRAVFGVHTGMITYPMLDFLLLAKGNEVFRATLGKEYEAILASAEEAVAFHDRQWRDGPNPGEGHYIMLDQEDGTDNKPKPGNRLSALGRSLWTSWKVTGNTTHRDRARAIGVYMKTRLTPSPDGAYYWSYWLPTDRVTEPAARETVSGEDSSHAALTLTFPLMLNADGEVFDQADMKRFANTVLNGFGRRKDGILFGDITGKPASKPDYVAAPAKWLPLAKYDPEVRARIVTFYVNYVPKPGPLDLALLLRYAVKGN